MRGVTKRRKLSTPVKLCSISSKSLSPGPRIYQRKLALLIPAHNEELIIAISIRSAVAAGQGIRDIYVVDDCSSDNTRAEAVRLLGKANVLTVRRSGKALAIDKAIKRFKLVQNHRWLHVSDADSTFGPNYFRVYRSKLDHKKYAVAVGFVQSMRGNWLSTYRAGSYTYSQHVNRRIQAKLGMVSVFPGPITCFRTDIIKHLDLKTSSLTEDFDITLQVHRKNLGKILFIPKAVNYTQDPQTLTDFCKQNMRWQRGFFQGVKKYKIGLRPHAIDISLGFQISQAIIYLLQMFVFIPYVILVTGNWLVLPIALAADFVLTGIILLASSAVIKRWDLIASLPIFYFLRWIEIGIFVIAFVEIYILRKFRTELKGWATEGRRYKLSAQALKDIVTNA